MTLFRGRLANTALQATIRGQGSGEIESTHRRGSRLMVKRYSDHILTRDAGSLRVPILLAHGRYDYTVPYTLWDNLETVLPTATRHVFLRSGHQPFVEEPDEFATVVAAWMKQQDDGRRKAVQLS